MKAVPTAVRNMDGYLRVLQSNGLLLASISETTLEKLHEARRLNLIEKHQVAELVEWFG